MTIFTQTHFILQLVWQTADLADIAYESIIYPYMQVINVRWYDLMSKSIVLFYISFYKS